MQAAYNIVTLIALAAVVIILGWGLVNMLRGGPSNLSQRLMRARVIAQFVAIILLVGGAWYFSRGG